MIISKQDLNPSDLAIVIAKSADSKKANDILVIDVATITSISDYFVICSASSDRQVAAIADNIMRTAREYGFKPSSIEGERQNEWVLIDFGSVVAHIFLEESRQFYRIERLFSDAPELDWEPEEKAV